MTHDEKQAFVRRLLAMGVAPQTIKRCTDCVTPDEVDRVVENAVYPIRLNNGVVVH